jgi:hypothetical protein
MLSLTEVYVQCCFADIWLRFTGTMTARSLIIHAKAGTLAVFYLAVFYQAVESTKLFKAQSQGSLTCLTSSHSTLSMVTLRCVAKSKWPVDPFSRYKYDHFFRSIYPDHHNQHNQHSGTATKISIRYHHAFLQRRSFEHSHSYNFDHGCTAGCP